MPIEIRELVIRTVVGGEAVAPPSGSRSDDLHGSHHGSRPAAPALDAAGFDLLVQACVQQVLLALARERER